LNDTYTGKHATLGTIYHDAKEAGWIDPEKFEKILLNLVSNAIKYTPAGGKVVIELEELEGHFQLIVLVLNWEIQLSLLCINPADWFF